MFCSSYFLCIRRFRKSSTLSAGSWTATSVAGLLFLCAKYFFGAISHRTQNISLETEINSLLLFNSHTLWCDRKFCHWKKKNCQNWLICWIETGTKSNAQTIALVISTQYSQTMHEQSNRNWIGFNNETICLLDWN